MAHSSELRLLLIGVEEGYQKKAWHGPNLRGSIRGLTPDEAAWRPGKGRHNIWEIVVHCAYWKYVVRRRITGERKGAFPLKGSNFFARPEEAARRDDWREDLTLLSVMHEEMVEALERLTPADLRTTPKGSRFDNRAIISGIAAHDIYHAGQIQIIKRLMR
jgi:uncharacterized damage-inducible protein DinB